MKRFAVWAAFGVSLCPAAGWEDVKALRAGENIQVVASDLKSWEGGLVQVNDESITLHVDKGFFRRQEKVFPRASVFRVSRVSRGRNTLIGLAIGAGAGGAVAAALAPRIDKGYGGALTKEGLAGLMIGIGAGVGTGIGYGVPHYQTVYRAAPAGR
ncbi:MAG: hypothetical protein ACE15B_24355 [Bryobacteraceae bacterium]